METLLSVDKGEWQKEAASIRAYYDSLGAGLPRELWAELEGLETRLSKTE
jgi:GTP-dependent phosphoenolpyruvate carboxykinase